MSDGRMDRIEALLERLARDMATKDELAALSAEMAALRAEMPALRTDMAMLRAEVKDDIAGVAKTIDVTAIGRQMRDLLAVKDDVTVLTAIVQRLDNTMVRQIGDL